MEVCSAFTEENQQLRLSLNAYSSAEKLLRMQNLPENQKKLEEVSKSRKKVAGIVGEIQNNTR
jgi:hypothetical protein